MNTTATATCQLNAVGDRQNTGVNTSTEQEVNDAALTESNTTYSGHTNNTNKRKFDDTPLNANSDGNYCDEGGDEEEGFITTPPERQI
jgi:hypothetical protein